MTTKSKSSKPKQATTPRKHSKSTVKYVKIAGLQGRGLIQQGETSQLELRDRLQMKRRTFERVVNVSERTIAKVESTAMLAEKLQRSYNELFRLVEALSEVVDPDSLGSWFDTPNEGFQGLKPIEVVERGEIDRLWEMVFRLRSGIPA
jgi:DNA-binding XRE family transcriptional regulator